MEQTNQADAAFAFFARTLIDVAGEVESAETELKRQLMAAAVAGDIDEVRRIAQDMAERPPVEVLAQRAGLELQHDETLR